MTNDFMTESEALSWYRGHGNPSWDWSPTRRAYVLISDGVTTPGDLAVSLAAGRADAVAVADYWVLAARQAAITASFAVLDARQRDADEETFDSQADLAAAEARHARTQGQLAELWDTATDLHYEAVTEVSPVGAQEPGAVTGVSGDPWAPGGVYAQAVAAGEAEDLAGAEREQAHWEHEGDQWGLWDQLGESPPAVRAAFWAARDTAGLRGDDDVSAVELRAAYEDAGSPVPEDLQWEDFEDEAPKGPSINEVGEVYRLLSDPADRDLDAAWRVAADVAYEALHINYGNDGRPEDDHSLPAGAAARRDAAVALIAEHTGVSPGFVASELADAAYRHGFSPDADYRDYLAPPAWEVFAERGRQDTPAEVAPATDPAGGADVAEVDAVVAQAASLTEGELRVGEAEREEHGERLAARWAEQEPRDQEHERSVEALTDAGHHREDTPGGPGASGSAPGCGPLGQAAADVLPEPGQGRADHVGTTWGYAETEVALTAAGRSADDVLAELLADLDSTARDPYPGDTVAVGSQRVPGEAAPQLTAPAATDVGVGHAAAELVPDLDTAGSPPWPGAGLWHWAASDETAEEYDARWDAWHEKNAADPRRSEFWATAAETGVEPPAEPLGAAAAGDLNPAAHETTAPADDSTTYTVGVSGPGGHATYSVSATSDFQAERDARLRYYDDRGLSDSDSNSVQARAHLAADGDPAHAAASDPAKDAWDAHAQAGDYWYREDLTARRAGGEQFERANPDAVGDPATGAGAGHPSGPGGSERPGGPRAAAAVEAAHAAVQSDTQRAAGEQAVHLRHNGAQAAAERSRYDQDLPVAGLGTEGTGLGDD